MTEHLGKICPFCKTEIINDDNVVICSACDMPHHKECWVENQGCTTFGCLGTIQCLNENPKITRAVDNNSIVFCSKCGNKQHADDLFCAKCGNRLNPHNDMSSGINVTFATNTGQSNFSSQGYSYHAANNMYLEDQYIKSKIDYYKLKFGALRDKDTKVSWNWAAFLVGPYWCMYRKMYSYGAGLIAASLVTTSMGWFGNMLSVVIAVIFGTMGNYIYMKHIEGLMQESFSMVEPTKSQHIQRNGGTDSAATVLTIIGACVLFLII